MAAILKGSPFRAARFAAILLGSTMLSGDALLPNGGAPSGTLLQFLGLASDTVTENTAAGQLVGAVTGLTAGSTLTLVDGAGGRFALSGTNIVTGATPTNFEDATTHEIVVRETLAEAVNSPRDTTISISVLNVNELPALNALTVPGSATVGSTLNISGATAGSTLTGTMPTGWTLNSATRTIDVAAGAPTGSQSWSLTETLGDSPNSPRTSTGSTTVSASASYEAETVAYVAAMTVPPSTADQNRIDTLVKALKTAGVWSKMTWFALHAAHDAQAGRINLINPSQVAAAVNSPTFTQYRGFTGDGATSYLNTGLVVGTQTLPFAQNDGHMGVWIGGTALTTGTGMTDFGARDRQSIRSRSATTRVGYGANGTGVIQIELGEVPGPGHFAWSRWNSTFFKPFYHGTALADVAANSAIAGPWPLVICAGWDAINNVPSTFSPRQVRATHLGSSLTPAEMAAVQSALEIYMNSLP